MTLMMLFSLIIISFNVETVNGKALDKNNYKSDTPGQIMPGQSGNDWYFDGAEPDKTEDPAAEPVETTTPEEAAAPEEVAVEEPVVEEKTGSTPEELEAEGYKDAQFWLKLMRVNVSLDDVKIMQSIDLSKNERVDDAGMFYLKNIKALKSINISGTKVTNEGLNQLMELGNLRNLYIRDTAINDDGVIQLKGLTQLKILDITDSKITDVGYKELKEALPDCKIIGYEHITKRFVITQEFKETHKWLVDRFGFEYTLWDLTTIEELNLRGTDITDEELVHLKELKTLRSLSLSGTKITDEGLAEIGELTHLEELYLTNTQVTDNGLEHLKKLEKLGLLFVGETKITDSGLDHLTPALKNLDTVDLSHNSKITDVGLVRVRKFKKLDALNLRRTDVSQHGVAVLQKALPNCLIYYKQ